MAAVFCRNVFSVAKRNFNKPLHWELRALSTTSPCSVERSINSVQLMGRVGADPQVVSGETNGVDWSFVQFPLATNEPRYIQSEDRVDNRTFWHNIIARRPSVANTVKNFVTKGSRVHISGKMVPRLLEPTEEGEVRRREVHVLCNDIILLTRTNRQGGEDDSDFLRSSDDEGSTPL